MLARLARSLPRAASTAAAGSGGAGVAAPAAAYWALRTFNSSAAASASASSAATTSADEGGPKRKSGLQQPLPLPPQLASFIGQSTASRADVTKARAPPSIITSPDPNHR